MIWEAFEAAAPQLAERGRATLERRGIALLGTLRRDGTPRISVIEPHIVGGRLLFGVMRSAKLHDLERDPRCTLHNAVVEANGSEGEFTVDGRVDLVVDPGLRDRPDGAWWQAFPADAANVYSMDVERAVSISWDVAHGEMTIEAWSPERGIEKRPRPYP